jgi:succinate dehydrogenase / fumarate reductase cytochrome b subunit
MPLYQWRVPAHLCLKYFMSDAQPSIKRPTSPHLSIYRKQISSVLSILHRLTGIALFAGTAVIVVWLWTIAYAPDLFSALRELLASPVGQICLLGWTAAFYYHLGNGIRHLFWDAG